MSEITTFRKQDSDLHEQAMRIRIEVFVQEQQVPEEIEHEFEEESRHYLFLDQGLPVGTARWRLTEEGVKLERFAVLASHRGKGVGRSLLEAILAEVGPWGRKVYLHSQIGAVPFYASNGFQIEGGPFWEAGIEHRKMVFAR